MPGTHPYFHEFRNDSALDSSLKKLLAAYENFARQMDSALAEISALDSWDFELETPPSEIVCQKNSDLLNVRFRLKGAFAPSTTCSVTLGVDYRNVNAFPTRHATEPIR